MEFWKFRRLGIACLLLLVGQRVWAADGVSAEKGGACTFVEGVRYSELVINARLSDFKAGSSAAGLATFDVSGHLVANAAGSSTSRIHIRAHSL